MTQSKTDPRVLRTRKLIMDSFIKLSEGKEFKDITIKDITSEAMINRATFYYHFEDIYDLLEKALSEVLSVDLDYDIYQNDALNEEAFASIFKAITNFQQSLSNRCHRGYQDTIARIIREQLEIIFYKMLLKQNRTEEDESLKITAVMLSWGIYGASVEWRRNSKVPPEEFIKLVIPSIMYGIDFESEN
ncbi:TetR/AcrR family transcriptional regulator [Peribacillus sp. NPDC094092]|uniref:TetR/AcrR family transcriptional regulator n=1 Tax=Peribacillus sp. NPDC094092 TaxID=3390611 RepID=UPI003CFC60C9